VPDDPKPRINPLQQGKVYDFLLEVAREEADDPDGGWCQAQEITREVLSSNYAAAPILEDLEEQGLVESRKLKLGAKGRPSVEYRIVTNDGN